MSNLIDHARRELELLGTFQEDPAFATSIVAAVSGFASFPGHSGGSAVVAINMLHDLLQFKNLSPLTNNPEEWLRHTPDMWDGEHHVWQNVRNGEAFSTDGGETYFLTSERGRGTGKDRPLYHSKITHKISYEEINVAESIQIGESYGVASASMAEPSDFYGGETDTEKGQPEREFWCGSCERPVLFSEVAQHCSDGSKHSIVGA